MYTWLQVFFYAYLERFWFCSFCFLILKFLKEQQYDVQDAVSVFLKQLGYNRLPHRYTNNTLAIGPKVDFTTDLCYRCNKIIEEGCVRMKRYRWHHQCFSCKRCDENLSNDISRAVFDVGSLALFCNRCHGADPEKSLLCFESVSLLEQYSFLLWVSLCRLDNLLRSSGSQTVKLSQHLHSHILILYCSFRTDLSK